MNIEKKLKLERVEKCLNCKWFVECDDIGKYEECVDYMEEENEGYVIVSLKEYVRLERKVLGEEE